MAKAPAIMRHPSGRPIRQTESKKLPIWRPPMDGPVTPRLREPQAKDAIGFRYVAPPIDQDD